MSTEREVESDCLERLRKHALSLMATNPSLNRDGAFARACTEMPKTTNRLLYVQSVLGQRGIKGAPIWE